MLVREIAAFLERLAPRAFQENYDNTGLITGYPDQQVSGILTTLDVTEAVIEEAVKLGCNLVVAHHPVIFKGIKKLTGADHTQRVVIKSLESKVSVFASHTNLDNIKGGVSFKMASKLGLKKAEVLAPKSGLLRKLVVFVPKEYTETVADSIHRAGAGNIGNYRHCSFRVNGTGTFLPTSDADPYIGQTGKMEFVNEDRIECIYPVHNEQAVLFAMRQAHPYEEVAYYINSLENTFQEAGSGVLGELENPLDVNEFLGLVKQVFHLRLLRHTPFAKRQIRSVALCGGAGIAFLPDAVAKNADAFLTSDVKYHEFFDADGHLLLCDLGHFESEQFTPELFYEILSEKFPNIAVLISKTNTNPVQYFT